MKPSGLAAALVIGSASIPLALAQQSLDTLSADQYIPRLVSIMETAQTRHVKLWLAGKAQNWELAAYELRQLEASLAEAAVMYSGLPVSNVTTLATPLQAASAAIDAKDGSRFAKAFAEVTDGCNACHRSMGRGFVVMRIPTEQPFGNQVFVPQKK